VAKDRSDYFRARTKIGRIELEAQAVCDDLGHEFFMIRDDRFATSFGCSTCKVWGCAEIDGNKSAYHGTIFEYKCGEAPTLEVTEDDVDILAAIFR